MFDAKSPAGKPKVFGLGLSKTGTSSLNAALKHLGYAVHSYDPDLLRAWHDGDAKPLFETFEKYDAFEDWPYPLAYKEIMDRYGAAARYVLTVRSSSAVWMKSQISHAERKDRGGHPNTRALVFGYEQPRGHEAAHIKFYEEHNAAVRRAVLERGLEACFAELCWERGDGWIELCALLGRPAPRRPFPHKNQGSGQPKKASWLTI